MTYNDFEQCLVNRTLGMLSGKWKAVILKHLADNGETRFIDLWRAFPRVSKKVMLEQLSQLKEDGFLERKEYHSFPPIVCYALTEKGISILPILNSIDVWAAKYLQ